MKMKLLSVAMLAGLGVAGAAQAVHVNPDGLGQVLLNPYFTVRDGYTTNINVVNTTDSVKAVKVRFLEGKNSQEVLDFNLYLSPYDEWTAVIEPTASGARLRLPTGDTSCTAPDIVGRTDSAVDFRDTEYSADSVNGLDRTREGYFEMIEMGNVIDTTVAAAATHNNGVNTDADCDVVRAAASAGGVLNTTGTTAPTGGLYGYVTLVNVNRGTDFLVDAVALDNFHQTTHMHTPPGSLTPDLADVNTVANIFNGGTVTTFTPSIAAIDAVSAVLMHNSIANDYISITGLNAKTDWVVTFPTKRFYNDAEVVDGDTVARAPFTNDWVRSTSQSCDDIGVVFYDQEERGQVPDPDDFSPLPPVGASPRLCNEVNTVSINDMAVFGAVTTKANIDTGFSAGWMSLSFTSTPASVTGLVGATNTIYGLPVIGFSAMTFENGSLEVGGVTVQSNYGGNSNHKGTRSISSNAIAAQ